MTAVDRYQPGATADEWAAFLKPLLAAMNQQPTREQFVARCAAIAFALPDVPASMLVPWRQRDAMRHFRFLPSPAEVAEWIAPALRDERESRDRHARLSGPSDLPAERPAPTPEEIAAVQAKARALVAELTHRSPETKSPPPRALPLSPGALLASYERAAAAGNAAAAFRARQLRATIEAEAAHA